MIVVIEQVRGDDHRLRWATRLVLWEDEPEPRLAEVLDAMTKDGCGLTGHQERALREALEMPG